MIGDIIAQRYAQALFALGQEKGLHEVELYYTALSQIEEKEYDAQLLSRGIPKERIYKYGFAFEGKNVLIEKADV